MPPSQRPTSSAASPEGEEGLAVAGTAPRPQPGLCLLTGCRERRELAQVCTTESEQDSNPSLLTFAVLPALGKVTSVEWQGRGTNRDLVYLGDYWKGMTLIGYYTTSPTRNTE